MEHIAKSENDRLQLEIQLNRLINSEESFAKTRAIKIKTYYQKLCDDEEKSLKRNRQLLNNLHRMDTQFLQLESKLERLTNLKKECEIFLRTAYPAWSNEKKLFDSPKKNNTFQNEFSNSASKFHLYEPEQGSVLNKLVQGNNTMDVLPSATDQTNVIGELVMNMTRASDQFAKTIIERPKELSQPENTGNINKLAGIMKPTSSSVNVKFEDDSPKTPPINMETNLLKEYEKHIKRQDVDTMNQTGSSTINFDMENTNNQLNKLGTWSQLGNNIDELPKASSTAKEEINLDELNKNGSIRQELSFNSLLFLLDYIELEIQHTIHPERYYRQEEPHYKTKLEIIKLANEKSSLDDTDPADISMIILEQLPHVIRKQTKNKCLFTADLMSLSVADVTDQMVALFLKEELDMKLWNRMVKHMNFLKRFASIDIPEIARKFAPAFLGFDLIAVEKATKFVEKILNDSNKHNENLWNKTVVLEESGSKTETTLNQELAATTNSKLKESHAYKDFINSEQKISQKENVECDESDENDEINNLLTSKPTLSLNTNQHNSENKNNFILKSPRKTADYDFDFSQSSKTDSKTQNFKHLTSFKSSKDKKHIPVYLKDGDSDEESDFISENSSRQKSKLKDSDSEFDFYR
ncbi:centrosomal kizuna-like [Brachionus plicatilis]|uniref:Centrosomal protein kizuna n=1 Tax=Brachionus plicatilis TaxID=10195 RepID=A0A3M7S527_BRAPC|nr:centrosomal kizuna-like [Brachionus plicatilis]